MATEVEVVVVVCVGGEVEEGRERVVVLRGVVWCCVVLCGCVWLCVAVCGCVWLCVIVCDCV